MSLRPDITQMLDDPDIGGGQPFTIVRRVVTRVKGRYTSPTSETVQRIPATGTLQPAGFEALQQLPEADRSENVLIVRTTKALYLGQSGDSSDTLADEIEYSGGKYKVLQVKDWGKWGMWVAYATRVGDVDGG